MRLLVALVLGMLLLTGCADDVARRAPDVVDAANDAMRAGADDAGRAVAGAADDARRQADGALPLADDIARLLDAYDQRASDAVETTLARVEARHPGAARVQEEVRAGLHAIICKNVESLRDEERGRLLAPHEYPEVLAQYVLLERLELFADPQLINELVDAAKDIAAVDTAAEYYATREFYRRCGPAPQ